MQDQMPPYPGQGNPLPSELGLDGKWIHEGKSFLFRSPIAGVHEFTGIRTPDGREADGFDVNAFAKHIGVDPALLWRLNELAMLRVAIYPAPTAKGADVTVRVEIQTPDAGTTFLMNRAATRGHA